MDNSEPEAEKVEVIEAMDNSSTGSDHKVYDLENKCSEENVIKSPQNQHIEHTTESSNGEDSNKIEQNTSNIVDSGSYNRKRVREKSKKLTRLLQDHEKMLRRNFNQGMKQIQKCKSLSTFTDEKYILILSNFPKFWSCINIKHYIEAESGLRINNIKVVENCGLHEVVKVTLDSFDEAKQVMDRLHDNEVEGIKLGVELKVDNDESDNNKSDSAIKADPLLQWSPDLDIWEIDPKGLYGLKPQFLKLLGIEPPIDKWIQVSNFRCEKSELRDVLELAGHVLMCTVMNFGCRRAKVMYSHPLEAVQAISMLNGQKFYGLTLKLEMDRCPNETIILPKGLNSIGMGLGEQGKPLRNVVNNYKRYVKGVSSSINPLLFSDADDKKSVKKTNKARNTELSKEKVSIKMKNVIELFDNGKDVADNCNETNVATISAPVMNDITSPNVISTPPKNGSSFTPDIVNSMNTKVNSGVTGSRIPVVMPSTSTVAGNGNSVPLAEPNYGVCIPRKACSPQSLQPVVFRPALVQVGLMPAVRNAAVIRTGLSACARSCVPPVGLNLGTFSVRMTNLPLTTTFPLLYEKLSVCGQIVSLQFTTPGCAVVSFANQAQAERCMHQFNMLNVDGHVINAVLM